LLKENESFVKMLQHEKISVISPIPEREKEINPNYNHISEKSNHKRWTNLKTEGRVTEEAEEPLLEALLMTARNIIPRTESP